MGRAPAMPVDGDIGPQYIARVIEGLAAIGVDYRDIPIDWAGLRAGRHVHTLRALVSLFREVWPDLSSATH
jgi:hypothetical protein